MTQQKQQKQQPTSGAAQGESGETKKLLAKETASEKSEMSLRDSCRKEIDELWSSIGSVEYGKRTPDKFLKLLKEKYPSYSNSEAGEDRWRKCFTEDAL